RSLKAPEPSVSCWFPAFQFDPRDTQALFAVPTQTSPLSDRHILHFTSNRLVKSHIAPEVPVSLPSPTLPSSPRKFANLHQCHFLAADVSSENRLQKILVKRNVAEAERAPSKSSVAIPSSKAQEFLAKLSRTKRNVWDRSRPDVQQWIMQFMQMGFDEQFTEPDASAASFSRQRLEADLQYWKDHARSHDQGRQHHYDENAPIGPRSSYRHGANVNYDYY
ncbi:hypothetical protein CCH79_00002610, partial [Gambusia affinis]